MCVVLLIQSVCLTALKPSKTLVSVVMCVLLYQIQPSADPDYTAFTLEPFRVNSDCFGVVVIDDCVTDELKHVLVLTSELKTVCI